MLPQTAEQGGVAERVSQLGAGIKIKKTDIPSLLSTVNHVLSHNVYRQNAALIAEGFKRCSGAKGAADKIEQVCKDIHHSCSVLQNSAIFALSSSFPFSFGSIKISSA